MLDTNKVLLFVKSFDLLDRENVGLVLETGEGLTVFGHATQLGQLRIPHYHTPTGSDLCITGHWNVVIRLAWCCFYIFRQNLVIITWGT